MADGLLHYYNTRVRSYEVSIWTLQDRFLSVLKWPTMDCKGQIQDAQVTLRDDGTQEFTFSIPKYYQQGFERIDNPMWLHLENQPLEANMHKLKVIFNKETDDEKVLEFLVTEVTHDHQGDNVDLSIKAEGLAFHELGKIGYKISLSEQNYLDTLDAWETAGFVRDQPLNNIQFWNDLVFKGNDGTWKYNWTYEVQMDWSAFKHPNIFGAASYRQSDVLYEDDYVSSWQVGANGKLASRAIQNMREKCRIMDISKSNIYNITQEIAKEFGVFCRYEYVHDMNYQIIGRKVIYYNNYLQDAQGHIDLTYPYNSTAITRTVDNSNVTTKMFVTGVDYDSDTVTIMDVDANRSKEDYLLNFDYLHQIQGITDEQYEEVEYYEAKMHDLNTKLIEVQERIRVVQNQIAEAEAQLTVHDNAISLDRERLEEAGKLRAELTGGTNVIPINGSACTLLYKEDRGFYINIRWNGLLRNTVKIYRETQYTTNQNEPSRSFSGLLTQYSFAFDEFQNVIRIEHFASGDLQEGNTLWLVGQYNPTLAYDNIQKIWQSRLAYDLSQKEQLEKKIDTLYYYLWGRHIDIGTGQLGPAEITPTTTLGAVWDSSLDSSTLQSAKVGQTRILNSDADFVGWEFDYFSDIEAKESSPNLLYYEKRYLSEKQILIAAFEKMMGPALREGYWNPENYHDYGDLFKKVINFETGFRRVTTNLSETPTDHIARLWDYEKYYDSETPLLYETNVANTVEQHLTVSLRDLPTESQDRLLAHLDDLCFVYCNYANVLTIEELKDKGYTASSDEIKALENSKYYSFQINSGCELGWVVTSSVSSNSQASFELALIVTGAKELDDNTYNFIVTNQYPKPRVSADTERIEYDMITASDDARSFVGYPVYAADGTVTWERIVTTGANPNRFIGTRKVANGDYDGNGSSRPPKPEEYQYKRVYPRIYFDTLKLKEKALDIFQNAYKLTNNEEYYVLEDDRSEGLNVKGVGYYVTLKPKSILFTTQTSVPYNVIYSLSNLDVAIYLDAIKVMKENAFPKVSYEVELSLLNPEFVHTAYNRLNQVVHINDNDLQLENISGYISTVTMDLDHPWQDTVEIKNYETKFEDLFTTIVAQTEAMKSNQAGLETAVQAFTANGLIDPDVVYDSMRSANLNLAFNSGRLTIDQEQGIWGTSDSGVVAFRGGGIFTATERDTSGNWIWNTGILPSGINANLITSGQLDTNKIRIFAGDQLKFQWNGEGLFAYKSFPNEYISYLQTQQGDAFQLHPQLIDKKQYVVYNSEGLFLTSEAGSYVMQENTGGTGYIYEYLNNAVNRVEVSWRGLILRNWENEEVFYADPNTGNLTLEGRIETQSGKIGGWDISADMLAGAGIQLISGSTAATNNGGIYLSNSQVLYDTVTINGATYYTYYYTDPSDGRRKTCYLSYYTPGVSSITLNGGQEVYVRQEVIKTVSPKYVFSVSTYSTETETSGTNTYAEATTTIVDNDITLYFAKSSGSKTAVTDIRGVSIEYDLTNDPNSAQWYRAAKQADPSRYTNYINEVKGMDYVLTSISSSALTLTPSVQTDTTFSVKASTGEVKILAGTIANFTIRRTSLTGGTITNSIFNIDNYYMAGSTKHSFGDCFCDIDANSSQGIFTLTRVDGRTANFNIAAMDAYKNAVAAAGSITLTLVDNQDMTVTATAISGTGTTVTRTLTVDTCGDTCTGTCKGGCETSCTGSCTGTCTDGCGGSCSGGCGSGCAGGCEDNCDTGCKNGCGRGCEKGCVGSCGTACQEACSNGCVKTCWVACANDCQGGCSSGCSGKCTTNCAKNCGESCGAACSNDCEDECIYGCGSGCSGGCDGSCGSDCSGGCTGGCKNSCKGTCDGTCTSGCSGACKGTCTGSCQSSCTGGCEGMSWYD